MTDDRPGDVDQEMRKVLGLVAAGKLSPAEADELLSALLDAPDDPVTAPEAPPRRPEPSPRKIERLKRQAASLEQEAQRERGPTSREIRRLGRQARRLEYEAQRTAKRELKNAIREAKSGLKQAFRLSVREVRRATREVESELRKAFDEKRGELNPSSWLANLARLDIGRDRVRHVTEVRLEQPLNGTERLAIRNVNGDVTVVGWDENRVEVQGQKVGWGVDREVAQDRAETMPLEIQRRGSEVFVEARAPVPAGVGLLNLQRMHTDLVVRVPRTLSLAVETAGGDVRLRGHDGEIEVGTKQGDVVLKGAKAETTVETLSGDISVRECTAPSLDLTTVSGDLLVQMTPQPAGEYRMRSAKGDVVARLEGSVATSCQLESERGDLSTGRSINVLSRASGRLKCLYPRDSTTPPPAGQGAELKVVTIKGDISVS